MKPKKNSKNSFFWIFLVTLGLILFHLSQESPIDRVETTSQLSQEEVTQAFIQKIAPQAVQIARDHDLYPSVMIAQAIHESNAGQSGLSTQYNNLFGIKGDYQGQSANLETWEDDGNGNTYTIRDSFRVYPTWEASLEDYADVLSQPLYEGVHRTSAASYQSATAALVGTYATDTSYAERLNVYIDMYKLAAYDFSF